MGKLVPRVLKSLLALWVLASVSASVTHHFGDQASNHSESTCDVCVVYHQISNALGTSLPMGVIGPIVFIWLSLTAATYQLLFVSNRRYVLNSSLDPPSISSLL